MTDTQHGGQTLNTKCQAKKATKEQEEHFLEIIHFTTRDLPTINFRRKKTALSFLADFIIVVRGIQAFVSVNKICIILITMPVGLNLNEQDHRLSLIGG